LESVIRHTSFQLYTHWLQGLLPTFLMNLNQIKVLVMDK